MPDGVRFFLILFAWLIVAILLPFQRPVVFMSVVTVVWFARAIVRAYGRDLEYMREVTARFDYSNGED